jgi:hypothetical protein
MLAAVLTTGIDPRLRQGQVAGQRVDDLHFRAEQHPVRVDAEQLFEL